jgi:hypothetical protein
MQEDNEQMDGRNGECEMCLGFANELQQGVTMRIVNSGRTLARDTNLG